MEVSRRPSVLGVLMAPLTLLERSRGRRRLGIATAYALVVATVAALAWRESRLNGLPDVGAPAGLEALRSLTVGDDRNAFTLYHRAAKKRKKDDIEVERRVCNTPYAWPSGDAEALAYLAANEEADELWRLGSERPDAMVHPIGDLAIWTPLPDLQVARGFARRALLRASNCRDRGDVEGAWAWYRAILRASRHVGRHTVIVGRLVGTAMHSAARTAINVWAADPRVDAAMLRRAIADAKDAEALRTPNSEALRIEYISLMNTLEDPRKVGRFLAEDPFSQLEEDQTDWRNHLPMYRKTRWFLGNEPERSRRVFKLAFANWMAHVDDLPAARPAMVGTKASPRVVFDVPTAEFPVPVELAAALESSLLAKSFAIETISATLRAMDRDRAGAAGLVVDLARQLYAREHDGLMPESDAELVGPYLDRWPDALPPPEPASKGP